MMPKETIRQHGIIEISERAWSPEEWREATKGMGRHPFDSYFPDPDWIEAELKIAREQAGKRLFRPHEDMGWYLERMIAELGLMNAWRAKGEIDDACLCAVELGLLMMEAKLKFDWEADALRGRKLIEGAASTRKADDGERRAIIEQIMAERGRGARDAFRQAARRHPNIGSESSFRRAYYKKAVQA